MTDVGIHYDKKISKKDTIRLFDIERDYLIDQQRLFLEEENKRKSAATVGNIMLGFEAKRKFKKLKEEQGKNAQSTPLPPSAPPSRPSSAPPSYTTNNKSNKLY
jgi:hypothetical protein